MNSLAASTVDIRCSLSSLTRARRSSILKPPMIASVDLDQFAKASPATPRLLNLWRPKSPWQPQSAGDH